MASFQQNSSTCYISKASINFISPPITPNQHEGNQMKSLHLGASATEHFKTALKTNWTSPLQMQTLPLSPPPTTFDSNSAYLKNPFPHNDKNTANTSSSSRFTCVNKAGSDSFSTDTQLIRTVSISQRINKRKLKIPYRSLPRTVEGSFEMPTIFITSPSIKAANRHKPHLRGKTTSLYHAQPSKKRNYSTSHCSKKDPVPLLHEQSVLKKPRKNSGAKQTKANIHISNKPYSLCKNTNNNDTSDNSDAYNTGRFIHQPSNINSNSFVTDQTSQATDASREHHHDNKHPIIISKKSKTEAASMFDNLSVDCDPTTLFVGAEEWIPSDDVFNRRPHVRIQWKGSPLKIKNMPYYEKLHAGEAYIAATLRLTPEQYLKCKWALILAAKKAAEDNSLFRKSEAQKVCCIDVNKTSVLWNTFGKLGWLGSKWPQ
ncbi:hypothetical protein BDF20DRAFT_990433 [Mycotypha africana]|uniref:uncharacterized protein n=1 Tax=Mycotypha africana TaxID=64632 RepID=UPI0023003A1C|nr:uncharacterized protein BDF20DRAFT_990433 [Mycotypha africana]KAI8970123.1 hypothetical protein BDF20DRAFT_990433 [Mycotypha africana]